MMRPAGILAVMLLGLGPGWADDAVEIARSAALGLSNAALQLDASNTAPDRIAALSETVRAYEVGLSAMREGLRRASLRERTLREALKSEDAELSGLLSLLQAVSRQAQTEAVLHPAGVVATIRAGTLAATLVPALQDRATDLESSLTELHALIAVQNSGKSVLEVAALDIRSARLQLVEAIGGRTDLPPLVPTDDATMEALINSTETLAAFADSLVPERTRSSWLGGKLWPMPVIGKVLRRYNEADAAGVRRPGWVIATGPEALVTAPAAATVRFSGDIPGQRNVTILEPDTGALVILAGMGSSFVRRSQIVAEGDPIGLMSGSAERTSAQTQEKLNEFFTVGGLFGGETLYMEVRQGRTPVDPARILRSGE